MYAIINLEGRVVSNLEFHEGKNGEFATFSVVVNQGYGERETASYFNCVAPHHMVESMKKAKLGKASVIHVNGGLCLHKYETADKRTGMSADVQVLSWQYVTSRSNKSQDKEPEVSNPLTELEEEGVLPF